jgi:hypothetical protein
MRTINIQRAVIGALSVVLLQAVGGCGDSGSSDGAGGGSGGGDTTVSTTATTSGSTSDATSSSGIICSSASQCDDALACTVDACDADGVCAHTVGPNSGPTACPPGTYCTVAQGCVDAPACATDEDCAEAWADDACKANPRCETASSVCVFDLLDKDGDDHAPIVCGGDDCNDDDGSVAPGANEACDAVDNDCDGTTDDDATCTDFKTACSEGACVCKADYLCGDDCVDTQTNAAHCGECNHACPEDSACEDGECTCALDVCDGSCVDVIVDSENCGECRHDCGGGECQNGRCLALQLASGRAWEIVLDDEFIYWPSYSDGEILRVPKSGGATETLATGEDGPSDIAVDDDRVYWLNGSSEDNGWNGAIRSMQKGGGAVTTLVEGLFRPEQLAVDDSRAYTTLMISDADLESSVISVSKSNGAITELLTYFGTATDLALSDDNIYVSTDGADSDGDAGYVAKDGDASRLYGSPTSCYSVAAAGDTAYWTEGGAFFTADTAAGTEPEDLGDHSELVEGLAVDAQRLYFVDELGVWAIPRDGGDVELVVADGDQNKAIALDDEFIYFGGLAGVFRTPKLDL